MIPSTTVLASFKVSGGGGGGGGGASISSRTIDDFAHSANPSTATYQLNSNGNVYDQDGTNLEAWLDSGAAGDYQSRATLVSGDTPTGTLGTWQALSTTRAWTLTTNSAPGLACTLTVEIRVTATTTVVTTATINLAADHS